MVDEDSACSGVADTSIFLLSGTSEVSRSGDVFVFNVTLGDWRAEASADGLENTPCGAELENFGEWIILGFMGTP